MVTPVLKPAKPKQPPPPPPPASSAAPADGAAASDPFAAFGPRKKMKKPVGAASSSEAPAKPVIKRTNTAILREKAAKAAGSEDVTQRL